MIRMIVALLIVLGVMVQFPPPDFTAHGCEFIYVGGGGSPFMVPEPGIPGGYAIALDSGMTLSGTVDLNTGEHQFECTYE